MFKKLQDLDLHYNPNGFTYLLSHNPYSKSLNTCNIEFFEQCHIELCGVTYELLKVFNKTTLIFKDIEVLRLFNKPIILGWAIITSQIIITSTASQLGSTTSEMNFMF